MSFVAPWKIIGGLTIDRIPVDLTRLMGFVIIILTLDTHYYAKERVICFRSMGTIVLECLDACDSVHTLTVTE